MALQTGEICFFYCVCVLWGITEDILNVRNPLVNGLRTGHATGDNPLGKVEGVERHFRDIWIIDGAAHVALHAS